LSRPVDGASLAALRIGFGVLLAALACDILSPLTPRGQRDIDLLLTGPSEDWRFTYPGMAWRPPLTRPTAEILLWTCVAASCFLAAGLATRTAALVATGTFTYFWTADAALYGNNFPLATALGALFVVLPTNRRFSVDRRLRTLTTSAPFWAIVFARAQVALIYFYGGVSKLHADWLAGEPMRSWFRDGATANLIRQTLPPSLSEQVVLPLLRQEAVVYAFTYGGLAFDLSIGVLLCVRRTRLLALLLASGFHLFNYFFVANVDVVALMAWWATFIFLDAAWPLRLAQWLRRPAVAPPDAGWFLGGMLAIPLIGSALGWKLPGSQERTDEPARPLGRLGFGLLIAWLAAAAAIPLRHFVIAGDAYWTEEGVAFSWFLMTRNKRGDFTQFRVRDAALDAREDSGGAIDWGRWNGPRPAVEIHNVRIWSDARAGDSLPEVFVAYEPVVGARVFRRRGGGTADSDREFLDDWRRRFARSPQIRPTSTAERTLADVRRRAAGLAEADPAYTPLLMELERASERWDAFANVEGDDAERRSIYHQFLRALERTFQECTRAPELFARLLETAPFAWQGGALDAEQWEMVFDRSFVGGGAPGVACWVDPERWGAPLPLYCDVSLLPTTSLRPLPTVAPLFDSPGPPTFLWNYTHELNGHQIKAMGIFPYLLRQYAEHVADAWERRQGRRPEVFVTSYAWLNHHGYQPLVDPQADLARAEYHLLRHNEWIAPMTRRPSPGAASGPVAP
jgi:hypothetical protein